MKIEPFKIKVTPEQSKIVQKVLFANGVRWSGSVCSTIHADRRYLLIIDNLIRWCERDSYYSEMGISELTFEQFQELYCQIPKPTGKVENPDYFEECTEITEKQQKYLGKKDPYKIIFGIDFEKIKDGVPNMQINGSTQKIPFYFEKESSQQEIDERLHEFGHNIPQQELVSVPDDRLDKIIERLDKIIELLSSNKTLLDAKQMLTDYLSKHH